MPRLRQIAAIFCLGATLSAVPASRGQFDPLDRNHTPEWNDAGPNTPMALVLVGNFTEPQAPPRKPASGTRRRAGSYKVAEVKNGGTVTGTIKYAGPVPPAKKIQVVKDHPTCDKHPKEVPLIKTDAKGLVNEAVVYLANIKEGKAFPAPPKKAVINQETCEFHPHVQAVRAGQPVEIVNSDPVAHNINASQRIFTLFNILQPNQNMRAEQKFDKPGLVDLKCNVHDWMHAYVHVFNHPYYAITGEDGSFTLENVPPGKYELAVWQEHLGEQVFEIEVKPGETSDLAITLEPAGSDAKK